MDQRPTPPPAKLSLATLEVPPGEECAFLTVPIRPKNSEFHPIPKNGYALHTYHDVGVLITQKEIANKAKVEFHANDIMFRGEIKEKEGKPYISVEEFFAGVGLDKETKQPRLMALRLKADEFNVGIDEKGALLLLPKELPKPFADYLKAEEAKMKAGNTPHPQQPLRLQVPEPPALPAPIAAALKSYHNGDFVPDRGPTGLASVAAPVKNSIGIVT